jgi:hypothetical protein
MLKLRLEINVDSLGCAGMRRTTVVDTVMEEQPVQYQECNDLAWLGIAYVTSDVKITHRIDYGMTHIT